MVFGECRPHPGERGHPGNEPYAHPDFLPRDSSCLWGSEGGGPIHRMVVLMDKIQVRALGAGGG